MHMRFARHCIKKEKKVPKQNTPTKKVLRLRGLSERAQWVNHADVYVSRDRGKDVVLLSL